MNCKFGEIIISYEITPKKIVNETEVIKNHPSTNSIVAPSIKVDDLSPDDITEEEDQNGELILKGLCIAG